MLKQRKSDLQIEKQNFKEVWLRSSKIIDFVIYQS